MNKICSCFVFPRMPVVDLAVGNPTNPSYIPLELFNFGTKMSFWERTVNTLGRFAVVAFMQYTTVPQVAALAKQALKLDTEPNLR